MPIVALPETVLNRLQLRLQPVKNALNLEVFPADRKVPALVFTQEEMDAFDAEISRTMIIATPDLPGLQAIIPPVEHGRVNYIVLEHPRAVARLDPFV